MFDIGNILTRAWKTLWNYKVLWIFGLLLVLSGASNSGSNGGSGSRYTSSYEDRGQYGYTMDHGIEGLEVSPSNPDWVNDMITFVKDTVVPLFATPEKALQTIIWIVVIVVGFCIVMGLLWSLVRYPSETASIRMVDEYDQTGTKVKFKEGWKLGWNRRAFRMWLVDLIIGSPAIVIGLLMLLGGILVAVNAQTMGEAAWAGLAGGIIFLLIFFLAFALFMIALGMLRELVVRSVAIEGATVGEAFKNGWTLFKRNLGHVLITWLVMLGITIGFGIASIIAFFVLLLPCALMTVPGAIVAAIPGAIAYGIASIFAGSWVPWAIGILVALPFFLTVTFLPMSFVSGWFVIFGVNVWTFAYRQFKFAALLPSVPSAVTPETPAAGK